MQEAYPGLMLSRHEYLAYRLPALWDPGASLEGATGQGRVLPPGRAPRHLPGAVGRGACWLEGFSARSGEIRQLAATARREHPDAKVQVAARRLDPLLQSAILQAGFEPDGVIQARELGGVTLGRWERGQAHPQTGRGYTGADPSPLALPGWIELNCRHDRLEPVCLRLGGQEAESAALEAVLYRDRQGRFRSPALNRYQPIHFLPSPTSSRPRLERQWLELSRLLAEELAREPIHGPLRLPPSVQDVRAFSWRGFQLEPAYTYVLELAFRPEEADPAVRKNIAKARRQGFTCQLTRDYDEVSRVLAETEERKSFSYLMSPGDFREAVGLVGEEHLVVMACHSPEGTMAAAQVALHRPGGQALDLLVGIRTRFRPSGAAQLLMASLLEHLTASGAASFDHAGANLAQVARAKSTWGGRLVPWYVLRRPGLRELGRQLREIGRFARGSDPRSELRSP